MLKFQNVTINDQNTIKRKLIDHVSVSIEDGSIVGLVGNDTIAKSAFLYAASGSKAPDRGQIYLGDRSLYPNNDQYMDIGYLPANGQFYEQITVEEYYELFLALYKVNGRYRHRRIEEVLEILEVQEYRNRFLSEIPAEIKPFISLGKTVLHEPKWLLLDDPFENLPITQRKRMLDYLAFFWEQGMSLVISTEIFPEIIPFFTDILVFDGGQLVSKGTVEDVYAQSLRESQIHIRILSGMEEALRVLRENDLVERVTVDKNDVSILFSGADDDEAKLLTQLVKAGALVHSFVRDPMDFEQFMWR